MHCLNQMLKLTYRDLNINIAVCSCVKPNIKLVSPRTKLSKDKAGIRQTFFFPHYNVNVVHKITCVITKLPITALFYKIVTGNIYRFIT